MNIAMVSWPICGSGQLRECWKAREFSATGGGDASAGKHPLFHCYTEWSLDRTAKSKLFAEAVMQAALIEPTTDPDAAPRSMTDL